MRRIVLKEYDSGYFTDDDKWVVQSIKTRRGTTLWKVVSLYGQDIRKEFDTFDDAIEFLKKKTKSPVKIMRSKTASPKDLIWAGSVQWESGNGSPTYAYVFGIDEIVVETALQHIQAAVVQKEFQENYGAWVPWLGQSKKTGQDEILDGIDESIKIRGPSRHQLDEMWFEGAHMPEVLQRIETEPLVVDLPTLAFDDLSPYCQNPGALKPFVIGVQNADLEPAYNMANTQDKTMKRTAEVLEQGHYVTLEREPNGNLKMVATDEFREEFGDFKLGESEHDYYMVMGDLIEDIRANSEWDWVQPEMIGALTDAPIITDGMDYSDDDGDFVPYPDANIWWYPNYMVRDFIEDLATDGYTIFTLAPPENEVGVPAEASTKKQAMMEGASVEEKLDTIFSLSNEAFEKLEVLKKTLGLDYDESEAVGLDEIQLRIGEVLEILDTWDE